MYSIRTPTTADELDGLTPPPAIAQKRRFSFASLLLLRLACWYRWRSAFGPTTSSARCSSACRGSAGSRSVSALAAFALMAIVLREAFALRRLASVQNLRDEAAKAAADNDVRAAKAAVGKLVSIAEALPRRPRAGHSFMICATMSSTAAI